MRNLELENKILRKQLEQAKNWMKKEVLKDIKKISFSKINSETIKEKNIFLDESLENISYNKIVKFVWEENFIYFSKDILENIISAEVLFLIIQNKKNVDWLWIITSYQKVFDLIIEQEVAKPFRKYFNSLKIKPKLENNLSEKFLHSVIFDWYILGFWKFFFLLKNISTNQNFWEYQTCFKDFLEKYSYIKKVLLNENFLQNYEKLVKSEVFWSKRHIWKIDFEELLEARKIFLWNLEDKNSIFFQLSSLYFIWL